MGDTLTLTQFEATQTQAEIDAPNYLDWSDARLGQFVRVLVGEIKDHFGVGESEALKVIAAAKILVDACIANKLARIAWSVLARGRGFDVRSIVTA